MIKTYFAAALFADLVGRKDIGNHFIDRVIKVTEV